MEGNALFEIQLLLLLAHGRVKTGADDAWGHAVHADVGLGTLARQRAGELWQRPLGHLVSDVAGQRAQTGGGRDQNNGAFLGRFHQRDGRAAKMEDRVNVDVKGPIPVFR